MTLLWGHYDRDGDRGELSELAPSLLLSAGTLASLVVGNGQQAQGVWLDRAAAETLREALDRLLDVDEQRSPAAVVEAAAIADRAVIVSETVSAHIASEDLGALAQVAGSVETLANDLANLARLVGRIGGAL